METKFNILLNAYSTTLLDNFDGKGTLPKNELGEICIKNLNESKKCVYLIDPDIDYYKAIDGISKDFKELRDKHYNDPLNLDECYDNLFNETLLRILSF